MLTRKKESVALSRKSSKRRISAVVCANLSDLVEISITLFGNSRIHDLWNNSICLLLVLNT